MKQTIAIIGGGAAGCFCAIAIKRLLPHADVTVYEGGRKALAKVAVTGGGRCNLTNSFRQVENLAAVYPRGEKLMKRLLKGFSAADVCRWFEREGVRLVTQIDECVFPKSQYAMEIVDTLLSLMCQLGVTLKLGHRVSAIAHEDACYRLTFSPGDNIQHPTATADMAVVTTGGSPTMQGLQMLAGLDLEMVSPVPSLFSVCVADRALTQLTGTVVEHATAALPGTKFRGEGPLLITHWGMSGPAVLKLSSRAARHLHGCGYQHDLCINWCGAMTLPEVEAMVGEMSVAHGRKQVSTVYPPHLNSRLWQLLVDRSQIRGEQRWAELQKKQINRLVNTLTADVYRMTGKCRFKEEFVTCGGVALSNVNLSTLECKQHEGLYFAGEVLDVDAVTGGFNLQAAWTMGHTVAVAINKKMPLTDSLSEANEM